MILLLYNKDNLSANIKLPKAPIFKTIQSGGFLGSLLSKVGGPLMKLAVPVAKKVLAPLGSTPAMSAIDAGIQKKKTWFWNNNFHNFK